ncbi:flagellar assembly protein A [Salinibacillus xinjiangensis]|uniref:DUF342 domain-containing protein n=1 Tax=Salinibacillus xinjiangensis TaxID=1229268 RepID=A0A6G1X478_9BACI|nr:flagellar assembly protein A [Salinibacillus xinjiangensis]MRG85715.1 DUF342 domain-containing protein [Salinibacillus xinjiangensis]
MFLKGKIRDEAIHLGLKSLQVPRSEVKIEVLQEESNGFVGLGRRQAVVKLKRKPTKSNSTILPLGQQDSTDPNLNGKAWVKNNQIFVRDSNSHYSTVSIGTGIQLMKNQQVVKDNSTIISEKDQLQVKIEENSLEQETNWKITLDQDKVEAVLEVEPGYLMKRKVKDVEPAEHISLTLEETQEVHNTLTYEQVVGKLKDLHVTYGIVHGEIINALQTTTKGKYVIAKGKQVEQGNHGWLEIKVDIDTRNGLVEDESGRVDFRETTFIPTVEKGRIIAHVHPPTTEKPGITVTNEPIAPKRTFPIQLLLGRGVVEVDGKLVATESGRPSIEQRGQRIKAEIIPKIIHHGNVDLTSGNIRFNGDVEIVGAVNDHMYVEAGGDIYVHKSIKQATVNTSHSIVARGNVVGAKLAAGKNNIFIAELGHLLGILQEQLEKMVNMIKQINEGSYTQDLSIYGLQPIISLLLEKKFKSFLPLARKYQAVVAKGEKYLGHENWSFISVSLNQIFLSLSNQVVTMEKLTALADKMNQLHQLSQLPMEPHSYITISDVSNSVLYCSGDIHIIGHGSVQTKIHAGGELKVAGMVRGGEVYGRLGVNVNEVGSESGAKTVISVPHDQKIIIGEAWEGTVLKIGNVQHTLKSNQFQIKAHLNENDRLVLH